jgi:hypothetical protein
MKTSKFLSIAALAVLALAVAFIPDVASAAQAVVAFVGPENLASLTFMGSVATTITKDVGYTGQNPVNAQPRSSNVQLIPIPINFPLAAPVANDTQALIKLPVGCQVIDYDIHMDDVDSNGTPTASLELGELAADLADISVSYKTGITIEQTGGLVRHAAATAATNLRAITDATKNTERVIGLKWSTAAATYVASKTGLLVLKVIG